MATVTAPRSRAIGSAVSRTVSLLGMLLLGWSVTTLGASSLTINCQHFSDSSPRPEPPATEFSISLVDLPDRNTKLSLDKSLEVTGTASDSTAPFLYLASRVTSMLREVFNDDASSSDVTPGQKQWPQSAQSKHDVSTPPVAESNSKRRSLPTLEASEFSAPVDTKPHFQRQMYRTDI
ncbi:MAG: hypothetical protein GXP15_02840 [Gammaproteobacteria bacterium]|nr:hypothetical protein [Gammaproteobacteria bacterium]